MNLTITDKLCAHIQAGYQPGPRGGGPRDDTLQLALDEIERVRRQLAEQRLQIGKLRRRIAELEG
jgi:hypothetical protein